MPLVSSMLSQPESSHLGTLETAPTLQYWKEDRPTQSGGHLHTVLVAPARAV